MIGPCWIYGISMGNGIPVLKEKGHVCYFWNTHGGNYWKA